MTLDLIQKPYYYQRVWELPWNRVLPLVSLYEPAGRPISSFVTLWNAASHAYALQGKEVAKNLIEFGATVFQLKYGLFLRTAMDLGDQLYRYQFSEVVPTALYLLTFLPFSRKNTLRLTVISLVVQAALCFYRVYKAKNKKSLETVTTGLMGVARLYQAYHYWRVLHIVRQLFVLMRHADKQSGDNPSLTDRGRQQAKITAVALDNLRKELGKDRLQIVVSSLKRSEETGLIIAETLGIPTSEIIVEPRIRESSSHELSRSERKTDPDYQAYSKLPEKEKFFAPSCRAETGADIYARMNTGIQEQLNQTDPKALPVFISHQGSMLYFLRGSFYVGNSTEAEIPADFRKHHSSTCEVYVIGREGTTIVAEKRFRPKQP